jgi:uncharacterized protein
MGEHGVSALEQGPTAAQVVGVIVESDVMVTMRDGVRLACDIYRPADGEPAPALIQRQPYDKVLAQAYVYDHPSVYARRGYVVVIQDSRGRYASEGEFYPLRSDDTDGYDTIEWCAAQSWCDGQVGSFGFSIPGVNQLLAAAERPPHLVAAAAGFYPRGMYESFTHSGGTFGLAAVMDWAILLAGHAAKRASNESVLAEIGAAASACGKWPAAVPLRNMPLINIDGFLPFLRDYVDHPEADEYWEEWNLEPRIPDVEVPCLHVSGWYDSFVPQTLKAYEAFVGEGKAEHRLLVGPWYHIPWTQQVGAIDYGDDAKNIVNQYQMAWFDAWLKNDRSALDALPMVRIFVTGENRWRDYDAWPPPGATVEPWYLHSGGRANSLSGDGTMSPDAPVEEPPDFFLYCPHDPVPSMGGHSCCLPQSAPMGPMDQRPVEYRNDVLVYSSDVLDQSLFVAGEIQATLWAATSARDTDFTVKLCDVHADGTSINLYEGVIRGRYREGLDREVLLEPDRIYEFAIAVGAICHVFQPGHRIRIEVSSSNFPAFDRNSNTGGDIAGEHVFDLVNASQTIFHDGPRPSRVDLPVVRD